MGGADYGWDNFENVYDDVSFLAGVTFAASDGNWKLALATHIGDEEETFGTITPNDERWVYSMVYSSHIDRPTLLGRSARQRATGRTRLAKARPPNGTD